MDNNFREDGIVSRQKIYDFILNFITTNGYSPTIREIARGTEIGSTSTIYEHLLKLIYMGKIKMEFGKSRTITLVGYKFVKIE